MPIAMAAAMGNWWLAASSWQCTHSCIMSHAAFFDKASSHPGDSAPLQPRFGAPQLLAFPKTEITLEREEISDCWWDSGKYNGAAIGNWENCVRSQDAYFEGHWGVSVLCIMFLVSSAVNVSTFHMTWLDTFWTGHLYNDLDESLENYTERKKSQLQKITYCMIPFVYHAWNNRIIEMVPCGGGNALYLHCEGVDVLAVISQYSF